jgi:glutamate synthase (NADPH/NADH) small chain
MYGIPEFRLPKAIVQNEVNYVKNLGVDLRLGNLVGRIHTIPELMKNGYDAVFIGSGAGLPQFTGCKGENLGGIYSANEFLIRVNLMKASCSRIRPPIRIGKHVGSSAAATLRWTAQAVCGSAPRFACYRRSRDELPARHEEIENAEEEGLVCGFWRLSGVLR